MSDNRNSPIYINSDVVNIRSNKVKVEENRLRRDHDDVAGDSRRRCCFGDLFGGMDNRRYHDDYNCHNRRKKDCGCF
ncbi:hypothetical protein [Rossellomorea sp. BNER]|uniref:hypothetical protein n=1 Tax=Rossellomorea sp. BNER TaxID=2962031 RepID=UPI003AF208EB|nr:hypothetical protein [Rossellomorea sp. BNER]